MRIVSIFYNKYTGQYVFVDHPNPRSAKGRVEFSQLQDLIINLDAILKQNPKKKIQINLNSMNGYIDQLIGYVSQKKYRDKIIFNKI